jgi:thermitase
MTFRRSIAATLAVVIAATVQTMATVPTQAKGVDVVVARQLIVRIDPALTTIAAIDAAAGTTTASLSASGNAIYLVNVAPGADPATTMATILGLPGVVDVSPNITLTPPEVDQSRIYAWRIYAWQVGTAQPTESQYAAPAVDLAPAQQISQGAGIVVAVIDTGLQLTHPAFTGRIVAGTDFIDGDNVPAETQNGVDDDGDGLIDEGAGHGTHVAGIIHQVAPGAAIMPIRALDDDGTGTMWNVTEAMYWAAAHGARVVNLSLGTHGSAKPLRDAVTALAAKNVLVVAAAGNDGLDRTMFPAAAPEAIAVGSVGSGDKVSTFSNFGSWIDVMAPGENIHSTFAFPAGSYAMNSGTSMATPWVTGEVALIASYRPGITNARVTTAIKAGAANLDRLNPSFVGMTGAGRIDIVASLHAT